MIIHNLGGWKRIQKQKWQPRICEAKVKHNRKRSLDNSINVLINNAGMASMNHSLLTPLSTVNKIFDTISSCLTNLHLRHYGIPNDNKTYTAIPYIAVNTPSYGSEFSDFYNVIGYTILSLIDEIQYINNHQFAYINK